MRKYTLADKNAKANIDLTDYSDIIANAVLDVMDNVDDVTVLVEKDCYYVSPTPSQGAAIRIGRMICKSALSAHCIHIPKLFTSVPVEEEAAYVQDE
jgi:hypothetical protein